MSALRIWRAGLAVGGLAFAIGCTEPDGTPAGTMLELSLQVGQGAPGETVTIHPYYRRVSGPPVAFGPVSITLGSGPTDPVPVVVDLAGCLRDEAREAGGAGCPIRLALALRSVQGEVVDSVEAGPFDAIPSGTITTPPIALRGAGSIVLTSSRDTLDRGGTATVTAVVRDRRGVPIAGRTLLWRTSSPAVATVSQTGVVTGVAPGPVTIRALVAADSAVNAAVALLVRGVVSVAIGPDSLALNPGQSASPGATITAVGFTATPRWTSANPQVATVTTGTGQIVAVAPGSTVIRVAAAEDPGVTDSMVVVVRGILAVTVSPRSLTLDPEESRTATASVTTVGNAATTVTWTARDEEVATVSAAGVITGYSPGMTPVVAASTVDATKRDSVMVTVRGVVSVSVTPDTVDLNVAQTALPVATVVGVGVGTGVNWQSTDAAVATVAASGLITAVAPGITTVVARAAADPLVSDSVVVRVGGVISVSLAPDSVWLNPADVTTPVLTVVAVNRSTAVNFTTSSPSVASVNAAGTVTALTPGRTIIRAVSAADPTRRDSVVINVIVQWTGPWRTVGDAVPITSGINLTQPVAGRTGAAWAFPKRPLIAGFSINFEFVITATGGPNDAGGQPGGEGFAVVIQNHDSMAIGAGGSGLGYGGIPRSLAIEFDTWQDASIGDPSNNHVAVHSRGVLPNSQNHSAALAWGNVPQSMSTGQTQDVTITYAGGVLRVVVGSIPVVSLPIDLNNVVGASVVDSNGRAWIGFTGATGVGFQNLNVRFITFP